MGKGNSERWQQQAAAAAHAPAVTLNTCLGSNSLGSIFFGAKYAWHTTKISALSLREACGFVASTFWKNCWNTHSREL